MILSMRYPRVNIVAYLSLIAFANADVDTWADSISCIACLSIGSGYQWWSAGSTADSGMNDCTATD